MMGDVGERNDVPDESHGAVETVAERVMKRNATRAYVMACDGDVVEGGSNRGRCAELRVGRRGCLISESAACRDVWSRVDVVVA
jgi:hypothetical protein